MQEVDQVRTDQGAVIVEGAVGPQPGRLQGQAGPKAGKATFDGGREGCARTPRLVGVHSESFNLRSHLVYKWGH